LALDHNKYVSTCLNPLPKPSHFQELETIVTSTAIDLHMDVILVHVGKNLVEDVLLDGGIQNQYYY
jgi:hypothetical protein